MNEEILEITKKFHDTYEKLSKEYNYETRKETRVFDINSNNGKLMYATVNEIISPILEENQDLIKKLKKQKEVIDKAVEYINQHWVIDDSVLFKNDLLEILEDKEVK